MPPRRQHMLAALPRRGTGERTQEASVRAGRLLAQCSHTAPDRIAAQELQHAFLHRTNVDGLAPASLRLCASGMRVFSPHVLTRDGHPLTLLRAHTAHRLPAVRRVEEGRRLLPAAPPLPQPRLLHHRRERGTPAPCRPRPAGRCQRWPAAPGPWPPRPGCPRPVRPPARRSAGRAPPLLAHPSAHHLALARHRAGATAQSSSARSHASRQGPGRLPSRHTTGQHDHNGRGQPSPPACVRPPSTRRRRAPPASPALPGPSPTRHHPALPPSHAARPRRCLCASPHPEARTPALTTLTASGTASAPESSARHPTRPTAHHTAIHALRTGRTGHSGHRLEACQRCGGPHRLRPSGGHRPGPQCQHETAEQGLPTPLATPLPGPYGLRTCPGPEPRRPCCRTPPRPASPARCNASAAARHRRAQAARCLGTALPGCTGIRHPWDRQRPSPPHLHALVPGGGLSKDRDAWLPSRATFSGPVQALAPLSRAICAADRRPAGLRAPRTP